jgi:hypothetical protein
MIFSSVWFFLNEIFLSLGLKGCSRYLLKITSQQHSLCILKYFNSLLSLLVENHHFIIFLKSISYGGGSKSGNFFIQGVSKLYRTWYSMLYWIINHQKKSFCMSAEDKELLRLEWRDIDIPLKKKLFPFFFQAF